MMKLVYWILYQFRRILGMNHIDMRFDAVEHRLIRIEAHAEQAALWVVEQAAVRAAEPAPPPAADADLAAALARMEVRLMKAVLSSPKTDATAPTPVPASPASLSDDPEFTRAIERVVHQVNYTNHNLYLHLREAMRVRDLYYRDLMTVLDSLAHRLPAKGGTIGTDHPIAYDTDDHKIPWGTAQDNTRSPRFVAACERHFGGRQPLTFMDLGCSGGGLVLDFILRGHEAYGVEGSDYSLRAQRAEWRMLPHNLFTADITRPFTVTGESGASPVACDVITAWEVMEHIANEDLPQLFANVLAHLKPDGVFIGSIALGPDDHNGASYHRTVQPRAWWEQTYRAHGLRMIEAHDFQFYDFCRGTGNGPIDGNYLDDPSLGFHFVAVRLADVKGQ